MICKMNLFSTSTKQYTFDDKNFIIHPAQKDGKIVQGTSNFIGVDGFCFAKAEDDKNIDELRLIQIKSGRLDIKHHSAELAKIFRLATNGLDKIVSRAKKNLSKGQSIVVKEMSLMTSKAIDEADRQRILCPGCLSYEDKDIPITIVDQDDFLTLLDQYDSSLAEKLRLWKP